MDIESTSENKCSKKTQKAPILDEYSFKYSLSARVLSDLA